MISLTAEPKNASSSPFRPTPFFPLFFRVQILLSAVANTGSVPSPWNNGVER